jgi:hypothetical protein
MRNFAAFAARLFAGGIVDSSDVGRLSGIDPPFSSKSRADESAQALWIIHAGRPLFEMCGMNEQRTNGRDTWDNWKIKFAAIAEDSDLDTTCRDLAAEAVKTMGQVEKEGITTNVVFDYGFLYMDGDTLVSNRPDHRSYVGNRSKWDEYAEDGDI